MGNRLSNVICIDGGTLPATRDVMKGLQQLRVRDILHFLVWGHLENMLATVNYRLKCNFKGRPCYY